MILISVALDLLKGVFVAAYSERVPKKVGLNYQATHFLRPKKVPKRFACE